MSNPYDPYSAQQPPQQPADPAAPTQFVPVQPPPQQPAYGAPQDSAGWGQPAGQSPYGAPQQQAGQPYGDPYAASQQQTYGAPQQAPAFGAPQQQPPAFGAPQQQGVPGFGTAPQAQYGYPTPVTPTKAGKTGGAKIAAALFGTIVGRLVIIALVAGGIAVYHFATSNSAHRDNNGNVSQAGSLGIGDLKTGDCFNAPSSDTGIESVTAIPCTQAHDSQVYAEPKITESTYPDDATLKKEAQDDCDSAASSVDSSVPEDAQEAYYAAQDSSTFDQGFNYIVCAIETTGKTLTKSYVPAS